jgi:3-deoxy-D-manno-octulosonate 8-phosphate phosphatase (KDO 8-P phosphatase)
MESNSIVEKLKEVKLLVMDVDGTLTDGTAFYSKDGEAMKRFSLRDGMGIELLRKGDIDVAILTTETSAVVTARAKKLKIEHVILGSRNKKKSLKELTDSLGLDLKNVAYIGDDVNDYQAMQISGVAACPGDSVEKVKEISDIICKKNGGYGAVREFSEQILLAQNKEIVLPENW